MKEFLLDTHAFLWWLQDNPRLGKAAREAISEGQNTIFLSAASAWEIAIKREMGKLEIPAVDLVEVVEKEGFLRLSMDISHCVRAGALPEIHKDPFDRILIAQAQIEGLTIITSDEKFHHYEVFTLDAEA